MIDPPSTSERSPVQSVELLGVPIHPVSPEELVETLVTWGQGQQKRRVYHVNAHAMNVAAVDEDFLRALQGADLVFCDGFGVKWGARLAGVHVPHRMTPPDWIDVFASATSAAGQAVFALGDEPGIAEAFQQALARRHAAYQHAGAHHGFFEKDGPECDSVVAAINESGATHLLVGFGMPLQERWIEANSHRLDARVFIPVGALYRWYTGVDRRAPGWMTDRGLEWLGRLVQNPRRHFQRYVIGNPRFLARVVLSRLRRGASR